MAACQMIFEYKGSDDLSLEVKQSAVRHETDLRLFIDFPIATYRPFLNATSMLGFGDKNIPGDSGSSYAVTEGFVHSCNCDSHVGL